MPDSNRAIGRDEKGRFAPGNAGGPGNPNVRRSAELQRAVREAMTPAELQAVIVKLQGQALEGDVQAARLLLERVLGKPREEPTAGIELPSLENGAGIADAMRQVTAAAAAGDVRVEDAARLTTMLDQVASMTVLALLEARVESIERDMPSHPTQHRDPRFE